MRRAGGARTRSAPRRASPGRCASGGVERGRRGASAVARRRSGAVVGRVWPSWWVPLVFLRDVPRLRDHLLSLGHHVRRCTCPLLTCPPPHRSPLAVPPP